MVLAFVCFVLGFAGGAAGYALTFEYHLRKIRREASRLDSSRPPPRTPFDH